jgi:predicted restriction endonuclease
MSEQDSSKVFRTAFNNMLERYFSSDTSISKIANETHVGQQTIRDFKKGKSNIKISNLEKILLSDIVDDDALHYFITEVIRLLKHYRNYQEEDDEDSIGDDYSDLENPLLSNIETGEGFRQSSYRQGQELFSGEVLSNYGNRCCFPDCSIDECTFLIGAHIARWADVKELRGDLSNGLCLCLMHDKAFEAGFFTLTEDLRVAVNKNNQTAMTSKWCKKNLIPYDGDSISFGSVKPSLEALRHHWKRISFTQDS